MINSREQYSIALMRKHFIHEHIVNNCFSISSSSDNMSLLIDINSCSLGEYENSLLLEQYNFFKKFESIKNISIIIPDNLQEFSSSFIATLYLMQKKLQCHIWIYGQADNPRVNELIHLMYSVTITNQNSFFHIATYNNHNSHLREWNNSISNVSKIVISSKNSALLMIDNDNITLYFDKTIKELLIQSFDIIEKENNLDDHKNDDAFYKHLKHAFDISIGQDPIDKLTQENINNYLILYFFKILSELFCLKDFFQSVSICDNNLVLDTKKTRFRYSKIMLELVFDKILDCSVYNIMLILLSLASSKTKFILKAYRKIFDNDKENPKRSTIKTLIRTENQEILSHYHDFILYNLNSINEVYNGIYEIVKNAVEHSTNHQGVVISRLIEQDKLNLIKNDNTFTEGQLLKAYQQNINLEEGEKLFDRHLDITVVDDGQNGIIETTLQELENALNNQASKRQINKKIAEDDRKAIYEKLNIDTSSQKELLFKMYFSEDTFLKRQQQEHSSSFGIRNFADIIYENQGIFRLSTNRYINNDNSASTTFYSYNRHLYNSFGDNLNGIGTNYNILLPIKHSFASESQEEKEKISSENESLEMEEISNENESLEMEEISNESESLKEMEEISNESEESSDEDKAPITPAEDVFDKMLRYRSNFTPLKSFGSEEILKGIVYSSKQDDEGDILLLKFQRKTKNSKQFLKDNSDIQRFLSIIFDYHSKFNAIILRNITKDNVIRLYRYFKNNNYKGRFMPKNKAIFIQTTNGVSGHLK